VRKQEILGLHLPTAHNRIESALYYLGRGEEAIAVALLRKAQESIAKTTVLVSGKVNTIKGEQHENDLVNPMIEREVAVGDHTNNSRE
jgi:hypothetical protein